MTNQNRLLFSYNICILRETKRSPEILLEEQALWRPSLHTAWLWGFSLQTVEACESQREPRGSGGKAAGFQCGTGLRRSLLFWVPLRRFLIKPALALRIHSVTQKQK